MYKSPIEIITTDIHSQIAKQQEDEIYKAVVSVGIIVDKEELIRALRYERCQYSKGYFDGKADAMEEIVRCKDCKHYDDGECLLHSEPEEIRAYERWTVDVNENDFCSYGERKEN